MKFKKKFQHDTIENNIPLDSTMILVERFNPLRDKVNVIFGEKIKGNVQTFAVDSPRGRYGIK